MFAKNKTDKMQIKSAWTPLTNSEANTKMFDERRTLVSRWFEKWSDQQRKVILEDIISLCKLKQIEYAGELVSQKRPVHHDDFTRHLPRVISLYIFSFLDPRSLSRCSRVCWHWKNLSELDNLWMPKCVRFGWLLPFTPSPYETGVWKRFYIENVTQLRAFIPKDVNLSDLMDINQDGRHSSRSNRRTPRPGSARKLPPWRGSDPIPKDIWRNNYLENDDETEKINKLRKKGIYGKESEEITRVATTKLNTGMAKRSSSVPRSQSSPHIASSPLHKRPDWAKVTLHPEGPPTLPASSSVKRPGPVKAVHPVTLSTPKSTPKHTHPPASAKRENGHAEDLFPNSPWNIPDQDFDSDGY